MGDCHPMMWRLLLAAAVAATAASATVESPSIRGTMAATDTLAAGASGEDGTYDGWTITIESGAGAGQTRTIESYTGGTKAVQPANAFDPATDETSTYMMAKPSRPMSIAGALTRDPEVHNTPNSCESGARVRDGAEGSVSMG